MGPASEHARVVPEACPAAGVPHAKAKARSAATGQREREEVQPAMAMLHSSKFGCFTLTPKQPGSKGGGMFGGFEGACKFDKKNNKTGCKKFISIKGPGEDAKELAFRQILFWCTQAPQCHLQRDHLSVVLQPTPSMEVLLARCTHDLPSHVILTDEEQDKRAARAEAKAKAKAKAKATTKSKAKPKAKASTSVSDAVPSPASAVGPGPDEAGSDPDSDTASNASSSSNSSSSSGSSTSSS